MPATKVLGDLAESVITGKRIVAEALTRQALADGHPPGRVLQEGLIAGMNVVGKRFKANEFYVPEVLVAARAMKTAMEVLRPLLVASGVKPKGIVVLGTVEGDLHDIGKNLVGMMLVGSGFKVVDLGVDVAPPRFVDAARAEGAGVVAVSALLTTTMGKMREVIQAVKLAWPTGGPKTLIGGAPITGEFASEIGADGFAPDAASAVDAVRSLAGAGA